MSLLQKSQSIELSRRTQPFYAKTSSYSLGQQVQIEVDTQREFLDFENARLVFDIKIDESGNTNTTSLNPWTAGQVIENLRVKTLSGQMIGHEIRQYRTTWKMFKDMKGNSDLNASYEDVLEGAIGATVAQNAITTVELAHRINNHIFGLKDYYPAHFHQGLMIEFDLPGTVNELILNSVNTTCVITIENPRFVCDLVQLKPEIENEMVRMMEEQKLFIDYIEWLEQENSLSTGASDLSYDIVGIDGRVKSAFAFTIDDADKASTSAARLADYGRNNLTSYRFRLGSRYLNYAPISCAGAHQNAQQCFELLKALDYHSADKYSCKAGDENFTPAVLDSNNFVMGVKVDKSMKNVDEVISSQVDKDRNNMRVELIYSAAPGTGASTVHTVVVLDKRLQLLPGSIVRNVRS